MRHYFSLSATCHVHLTGTVVDSRYSVPRRPTESRLAGQGMIISVRQVLHIQQRSPFMRSTVDWEGV